MLESLLLGLLDELLLGLEELEEPLMPELDEPELMPPEVAPLAPPCRFFSWASHSDLLIMPSWLVSILSNSASAREDEAPELDDVPPADELGELDDELGELDDDDVPPAADDVPPVDELPLDDGVLLCDVDGEALEPELALFFASSA